MPEEAVVQEEMKKKCSHNRTSSKIKMMFESPTDKCTLVSS